MSSKVETSRETTLTLSNGMESRASLVSAAARASCCRAASLLFLELIYTFIVAQASCLWGNRASRLVKLIVGRQDACRPAQPGWLCSFVLHWIIHETQAFRLHALVQDA